MNVDATALHPGVLEPPPSKSDAHRAFAFAWMLQLPRPVLPSGQWPDDVQRIAKGLDALGTGKLIDCGDGAAPFRLLAALAAVLPERTSLFTGSARLAERPHAQLFESLGAMGATISGRPWPLTLVGKRPNAQRVAVDGQASSQYASALVVAGCRVVQDWGEPFEVELGKGPTVSRGYLDITVRWARQAGFTVEDAAQRIRIMRHGAVASLPEVPPDWSSLGYLLLMAHASGSRVAAASGTEHPDASVLEHLRTAGLDVKHREGHFVLSGALKGPIDANVSQAPDLAPTLTALALAAKGTSVLRDVGILRNKESDRLAAILDLANAVNADARLDGDTVFVTAAAKAPAVFRYDCRNDHRLTLSATTLACLFHCRAELLNTHGVDKSFPGFFEQAARVGVVARD